MNRNKLFLSVILASMLVLSACGTRPHERVVSGAGIGVVGGALFGGVVAGPFGVLPGAVVGGLAGGVTGGVVSPRHLNLGPSVLR